MSPAHRSGHGEDARQLQIRPTMRRPVITRKATAMGPGDRRPQAEPVGAPGHRAGHPGRAMRRVPAPITDGHNEQSTGPNGRPQGALTEHLRQLTCTDPPSSSNRRNPGFDRQKPVKALRPRRHLQTMVGRGTTRSARAHRAPARCPARSVVVKSVHRTSSVFRMRSRAPGAAKHRHRERGDHGRQDGEADHLRVRAVMRQAGYQITHSRKSLPRHAAHG